MTLVIVTTVLSGFVMLVGIFWTLQRRRRLKSRIVADGGARRWTIGGHAEFSIPAWIAAMRSGRWNGPALPLLVAFLGMVGLVYGLGTTVLLAALQDSGPLVVALVVVGLLYVTCMLGWALIDSNIRASRVLREKDSRGHGPGLTRAVVFPGLSILPFAVLLHAPLFAQADSADLATSGPMAVDPAGFAAPSQEGFELRGTHMMDASPAIEGPETAVEIFLNPPGDTIYRISLHGVTWGYGWLPGGEATEGHILRDSDCDGDFDEKWSPTAPFSAPECAVTANPMEEGLSE